MKILTIGTVLSTIFAMSVADLLGPLKPVGDDVTQQVAPLTFASATTVLTQAGEAIAEVTSGYPDSADVKDGDIFDIIIVGGGTAGCILANRLTEIIQWKVAVVEAGGDPSFTSDVPGIFQLNAGSSIDWAYPTVNDGVTSQSLHGGSVTIHTGRVLGGASSISYLTYNRGKKETYDDWNVTGWDFNSVLKYFKKLENYRGAVFVDNNNVENHGYDGPIDITTHIGSDFEKQEDIILAAYEELGYKILNDLNNFDAYGVAGAHILASKSGERSGTAQKYLLPIASRPNLYVLKHTLGLKVLFDNTNRAVGVEVLRENGNTQSLYANVEVILSAGVYRSPQLLMLSGIGTKNQLEKLGISVRAELPVGLYYKDPPAPEVYITGLEGLIGTIDSATSLANLGTLPIPVVDGTISVNSNESPSIQVVTNQYATASPIFYLGCLVNFNVNSEVCNRLFEINLLTNIINPLSVLTDPKSSGNITLNSTDPTAYPIIHQGYYVDERDLETAIKGIKSIAALTNTTAFVKAGSKVVTLPKCDGLAVNSEEYFRCQTIEVTSSLFYGISSCKMGSDGVVDNELRVYNTTGLRVVDASIIPSAKAGEPLSMVMMVAEKASDIIKQTYGFL